MSSFTVNCTVGEGMCGNCNLQDPSVRLEGRWAHPCAHVMLGLPAWGLGTSQHPRGAWRDPCLCPTWGHLALGSCHWTQGEWV